MSSSKFWSPKKRAIAVTLRGEGYSYRQVAQRIGDGATASGVLKVCRKFDDSGTVADKQRSGRPRLSTDRQDRSLVRLSLGDRQKSSVALKDDWEVEASTSTVKRRLSAAGLRARVPRKKPFLNVEQRKKRLLWARVHKDWTVEQWGRVLWSDETRISLFCSDGVRYVRRRQGEALKPECLIPTMKHPVDVMIWGCMAANGVGRIFVLQGSVNARKYIDEVLIPRLLPSSRDLFLPHNALPNDKPKFIFQQDNAPCHTAKVCRDWFAQNGVQVLDWPGNSPDLNPIENLWARLKRLVAKRRPSNRQQLIEAVIASWHHVILPDNLRSLVESMPKRCADVIKARGYPTRY